MPTQNKPEINSLIRAENIRLKKLAELSLTLSGDPIDIFKRIAEMIAELMNVRVVCLSEIKGDELFFISVYVDGEVMHDAGQCPINITPCATVENSKDLRVYDKVIERFPQASFLKDHNAYSYCGFPAIGSDSSVVAVTCLLDDKPHEFTDEDQDLLRVFGQRIAFEIERKQQQDKHEQAVIRMREREQHYRHLVESANAMPWTYDLKSSRFTYMGPQAEQILGYPVSDWHEENFWPDHIHPGDRDWAVNYCLTETEKLQSHDFEYRMIAKDGRTVWIRDSVNIISDESGPLQLQGFMFDITERKNVEDAINSLAEIGVADDINEFFNLCVSSLARVYGTQYAFIGIITDDQEEKVQTKSVWAGGNFVDNFEYELAGTPCANILDQSVELIPDDADKLYPHDQMLVDMGVKSYFGTPLIDSSGKTIGLISILDTKPMELSPTIKPVLNMYARRISAEYERYLAMEELEKRVEERTQHLVLAREEAMRANNAKSEFLSRMSHELRTPLNAIIGFGQLLENEELNFEQKDYLSEITQASDHLLNLINEVLDLAKIESGSLKLNIQDVTLDDLIKECIALIRPPADKKHIHILNHSENSNFIVSADRIRLKEIILNLLSNAVKYNVNNGKVEIYARKDNGRINIEIVDTGPGIDKENKERIFMPFSRLEAEYSEVEGSGIGLSISRQLIELMGGEIGVESEPGAGSRFWITCPASADSNNKPGKVEHPESQQQARILYVEDNPANLRLVEKIIQRDKSYKLLSATTAKEGIETAISIKPDLIIMDLNLPDGISGFDALEAILEHPDTKNIPVIALSASAMEKDIERGLEAGFKQYLTKPVQVPVLLNAIKSEIKSKANK